MQRRLFTLHLLSLSTAEVERRPAFTPRGEVVDMITGVSARILNKRDTEAVFWGILAFFPEKGGVPVATPLCQRGRIKGEQSSLEGVRALIYSI